MSATARITLVQEEEQQYAFLIFQPIYRNDELPSTISQRREELEGFALGVFRIGDMIKYGLHGLEKRNIRLRLLDEEAPIDSKDLLDEEWGESISPDLSWSSGYEMAGRSWGFHFFGNADYLKGESTSFPWLVMAAGLMVCSMLGAFLLVLTGRATRIEEQVSQRTAQLRDSESRTQAIVENAVEAVITVDESGVIESVNIATMELFGYSEKEMVGKNVSMLMPRPHRENHQLYMQRYLETGIARVIGSSREVDGLRKDGSLIPLELSVSDVRL